jgi:hypothetical protein
MKINYTGLRKFDMATITPFKKDGNYLHLTHLLIYLHRNMFSNFDISSLQTTAMFMGKEYTIPENYADARERVINAYIDPYSKVLLERNMAFLNKSAESVDGDLNETNNVLRKANKTLTLDLHSAIRKLYASVDNVAPVRIAGMHPRIAEISNDLSVQNPFQANIWIEEKLKRLRQNGYQASEWVEVSPDHSIGHDMNYLLSDFLSQLDSVKIAIKKARDEIAESLEEQRIDREKRQSSPDGKVIYMDFTPKN